MLKETLKKLFAPLFSYSTAHLSYALLYEETLHKVEIKNIICEKGKEPIYDLRIRTFNDPIQTGGLPVKISKSQYDQFIGEGNNAIRKKQADLFFRLVRKYGQPNLIFHLTRNKFPWDDVPIEFSEQEVLSLGYAILDNPNKQASTFDIFESDWTFMHKYMEHFQQFQSLIDEPDLFQIMYCNRKE